MPDRAAPLGSNQNPVVDDAAADGVASATYICVAFTMRACRPYVPTSAAAGVTVNRPAFVADDDQALRRARLEPIGEQHPRAGGGGRGR